MKYFLYKLERECEATAVPGITGCIVEFSPFNLRWLFPLFRVGRKEYVKGLIMVAWTVLAGMAKINEFRVYAYVASDGNVLHYSVVSPTVMHLPWLGGEEAETGTEIGGCLTVASARGMKIYPYVLHQIASKEEHALPLYMIVDESNVASQTGIKRAGFEFVQQLQRISGLARPPHYESLEID